MELALYQPFLHYLVRRRWLRPDTLVISEFPLHGRSVDFVTLSPGGRFCAYEFKTRDVRRALQQAAYNLKSFDRSYAVLGVEPTQPMMNLASELGIGIFVVNGHSAKLVMYAGAPRYVEAARSRAQKKMKERAIQWGRSVRL